MGVRSWRIGLGAAALLVLAVIAARLGPYYLQSLEFRRALETIGREALAQGRSDEAVRAAVVNAAARRGLRVTFDGVALKRTAGRLEIQVLYDVPVSLPLYSVDLHFRPRVRAP
jgi:Flp pilus assembly protein TadG